jgi:hypothetical protein
MGYEKSRTVTSRIASLVSKAARCFMKSWILSLTNGSFRQAFAITSLVTACGSSNVPIGDQHGSGGTGAIGGSSAKASGTVNIGGTSFAGGAGSLVLGGTATSGGGTTMSGTVDCNCMKNGYMPVCGTDGQTHDAICGDSCVPVPIACRGACPCTGGTGGGQSSGGTVNAGGTAGTGGTITGGTQSTSNAGGACPCTGGAASGGSATGGSTSTEQCPQSPPTNGNSCGTKAVTCFYDNCPSSGRTLAVCMNGNWSVQTGTSCNVSCGSPTSTSFPCQSDQICLVVGGTSASCAQNTCSQGLIAPACLGNSSCTLSASLSNGATLNCAASSTGGSTSIGGTPSTGGAPPTGGAQSAGGTRATGGSTGTSTSPCGGCTSGEICIWQVGGPGPSHYACATQLPCGAAGACACIVDQGTCDPMYSDAGICNCDNGMD